MTYICVCHFFCVPLHRELNLFINPKITTTMTKKFICPICGYVHEGAEAPERCPQCKQIVEWKVASDDKLNFVCEHV